MKRCSSDLISICCCKEEYALLTIRLARTGKKKHPSFRIVVLEKSKRRDGRYIDQLGHYNPKTDPASIHLDK